LYEVAGWSISYSIPIFYFSYKIIKVLTHGEVCGEVSLSKLIRMAVTLSVKTRSGRGKGGEREGKGWEREGKGGGG